MRCTNVLIFSLAMVMGQLETRGTIIAYEPFGYQPAGADLWGKGGGTGFAGVWAVGGYNASIHNNYDLTAGSFGSGDLQTTGGGVRTGSQSSISGLWRSFSGAALGTPGTTAYLSFVVQPQGTLNAGAFNGFFGLYLDGTGNSDLFLGKPGSGLLNRYVMESRGGSAQSISTVNTVAGESALLVLKAEFNNGLDRFTMYVNPTPGAPEPAGGVLKTDLDLGSVNALVLYSTGEHALDEIRVGQTFADVTPIPEPGVFGLLVLGGCLAWLRCRKS